MPSGILPLVIRFLKLSPSAGSILITSAPKSDMIVAAEGPAMKLAASITLIPSNRYLSFILKINPRRLNNHNEFLNLFYLI